MTPLTFVENNNYFVAIYYLYGNLLLRFYKKLDENHGKLLYEKYIKKLDKYNNCPEWDTLVNFIKNGICDKLFFNITKNVEL